MQTLVDLNIPQPFIALFGSGSSVHNISAETFALIKANAFVITLNYAPIRLHGHMNMWSDRKVSDFLAAHYSEHPKDCLFLVRTQRSAAGLKNKVDYWFDQRKEGLRGNYTIVWALQLLQKYFPEKKILLFGVDMSTLGEKEAKWYDRYTAFDRNKRGVRYNAQLKLEQCARQIEQYCRPTGVFNCNLQSRLAYFPKKDWRELMRLKVLHLCPSALAGAPAHLSSILNKYSLCDSRSVLQREFSSPKARNLKWDYDLVNPSSSQLKEAVEWADILHFHRKVYQSGGVAPGKKSLLQFHSQPNGYRPNSSFSEFNGRKLVIAQYHPRYYTDALVVPNLIDIWSPTYQPETKSRDVIKIFYSWATETKKGWGNKGSTATKRILKKIEQEYGSRVAVRILNNRPYTECMAEKRTAQICIDECVTGSYHLQSLEGAAVGAVTLNNIDETTHSYLRQITGGVPHPFVKTDLDSLYKTLCNLLDRPEELRRIGTASRTWMEENWDPRRLVSNYTQAYFNLLARNTVLPAKLGEIQNGRITPITVPGKKKRELRASRPQPESIIKRKIVMRTKPKAFRGSGNQGKPISELYQKYKDQDIYIFGTGPSLLKIDPEDYKDKICFGINFSFEKMPYMDHILVHVVETYEAMKEVVDNQKLLLPETLVHQWYRQRNKIRKPARIPVFNEEAYVYSIQDPYERRIHRKEVSLEEDAEIFTWTTATHSAIHLAAYLGAKNIYLIGVDYELFPNGRVHFDSRYSAIYGAQDWNALAKHREGDHWLNRELSKAGVQVVNLKKEIEQAFADSQESRATEAEAVAVPEELVAEAKEDRLSPETREEAVSATATVEDGKATEAVLESVEASEDQEAVVAESEEKKTKSRKRSTVRKK